MATPSFAHFKQHLTTMSVILCQLLCNLAFLDFSGQPKKVINLLHFATF